MNGDTGSGIIRIAGQVWAVFKKEAYLFRGRPMLWLAALVISLIPALYTVIYLGAIWDPYGNMSRLPAGVVNRDKGTTFKGREYNLGAQLVGELRKKNSFRLTEYPREETAGSAVRAGEVYFALIIPPDFSGKALPGSEAASLTLVTSQGTSYVASLVAERFAADVVGKINRSLGVERWKVVLSSGKDARSAALRLRDGAGGALAGAEKLHEGLGRADAGAAALAENQKKLSDGLKGIDLQRLVSAGSEVHGDTAKLASGLARHRLIDSLAGLPPSRDLSKLAAGAEMYQGAIVRLAEALEKAAAGAETLAEKDREFARGVGSLKEGSGILRKGIGALHAGLKEFAAAMPAGGERAEDLAASVAAEKIKYAAVTSNGPAFAPYFMGLSLWLGVLMSSFLFRLIVFPRSVDGKRNIAKIVGKGIVPLLISGAGALFLGLTVRHVMKIPARDPFGFYAVLLISAFAYNAIILSLVRLIGDAGKLLSVLFLVVQIASAGGAYPIELSPHCYRAISQYLPLTHVVRALRAAMFGSYDGDWARAMLAVLPWIIVSLALSALSTRRFKCVEDADYGPALDLSFKR